MRTARFFVEVTFDETKADADSIAGALDNLMGVALSTPEILDDYGPVQVGEFIPETVDAIGKE